MGSNTFGNIFKITTWGESHGKAIGVVIDGCPAGLEITEEEIALELEKRRPGHSLYTSPRKEPDHPEILSGVFQGKTTGTPISILIYNHVADSTQYETIKNLLRPGHANYTYLEKYGIYDHRGGGRASGRETACRVAAGAIAKKFLLHYQIQVLAYLKEVHDVKIKYLNFNFEELKNKTHSSAVFCPDEAISKIITQKIEEVKNEGDSLGGVVELVSTPLPVGLGDPVYEKLEANLAYAMLSIPASKGIEFGSGFLAAHMKGSKHNDLFEIENEAISTKTNHAGGTLGGISTGMPLNLRVVFKPTSSIKKTQTTIDFEGKSAAFTLAEGAKHDPCLAIRAVPVVEAMGALVLADSILMNRSAKI